MKMNASIKYKVLWDHYTNKPFVITNGKSKVQTHQTNGKQLSHSLLGTGSFLM